MPEKTLICPKCDVRFTQTRNFSRHRRNQEILKQSKEDKIKDLQTGSIWNLKTGLAIDGELKGKQLIKLPLIPSSPPRRSLAGTTQSFNVSWELGKGFSPMVFSPPDPDVHQYFQ